MRRFLLLVNTSLPLALIVLMVRGLSAAAPLPSFTAAAPPTMPNSVMQTPALTTYVYLPLIVGGSATTTQRVSVTIATLGDSLTEGQGDETGQGGYPARLLPLVQGIRPGSVVTNFGHSGWSSDDLINGNSGGASQLTLTLALSPTIALVWIGSNDLWYLYEFGDPTLADELQDAQHYSDNLNTILSQLRGQGVIVFVALLDDQSKRPVASDPLMRQNAFPGISAAEVMSMSLQVTRYNNAIMNRAAQHGATTVDFFNTTIFTNTATLDPDGNHPNAAGYDLITQIWFNAIRAVLP